MLEVTSQSWNEEGTEDEIGTLEGRERKPEEEDELEGIVEGEPVDDADEALDNGEERENDPVCKPLRVVVFRGGEKRFKRVVTRDDEAGEVGQELTAEVEDDKEEVESDQADDSIRLRDSGLLLEINKSRVPGELSVELADVVLDTFLRGSHLCDRI